MRLDAKYIAEFLDADGSIYIAKFARKEDRIAYIYGQVSFTSQNIGVLEDIRETVGGHWSHSPKSRYAGGAYSLVLCAEEAESCLKMVLPYLRVKAEQARLVLRLYELVKQKKSQRAHAAGRTAIITAEEYKERLAIRDAVMDLNRKDAKAYKTNWVNSAKTVKTTTPSQAVAANDSTEGVTTREVSANDNPLHEDPARKGKHSLSSVELKSIQ